MPYIRNEYAECPRCGKTAIGEEEIKKEFGYRTMEDGKVIPQSHCKTCRSRESNDNRR